MNIAKAAYLIGAYFFQTSLLTAAILPYLLDKPLWYVWSIVCLVLMFAADAGASRRISRWNDFGGKL